METKNYFIIVVVIVAFALISINMNNFTGLATKGNSFAIINVNPSSINAGDKITIEVMPGKEGVKNEIGIYSECKSSLMNNCKGNRMEIIHLCSGSSYTVNCREPNYKGPYVKEYKTQKNLIPGLYYVKITEYKSDDSGNYIERKAYFRVE